MRGRVGYIGQTNFRPFDTNSFEYQAADDDRGRRKFLNYGGTTAGIWCIVGGDSESAQVDKLVPLRNITDADSVLGIVADTFINRHSLIWYARNVNSNMSFTIERTTHYEGIPDPHQAGFAQY